MPIDSNSLLWAAPVLWLAGVAAIVLLYLPDIRRLWREPVLRYPVLIVESDDWGAGPLVQASALHDIAGVLRQFRDAAGRSPVLSLAVVLAVPNGRAISADGTTYRRTCLDEPPLAPILDMLKQGEAEGLFSIQLHGLEHFWPDTLMASEDATVRKWLREPEPAFTERLPPHLQIRWIDATVLPSKALARDTIRPAVTEEVDAFVRVFGRAPRIVVPPTFVWTGHVECAWAASGIECVITPGERYTGCAADGAFLDDGERFANGDRSGSIIYLVRCDYFEPSRGRGAEYALRALRRASSEGRPCVLENHRDNFCRDPAVRVRSLGELEKLVAGALKLMPTVRFLSSGDLFRVMKTREPQWLLLGFNERFPFLWQRLRHTGRLWTLLKFSGAVLPGELLMALKSRAPACSHV